MGYIRKALEKGFSKMYGLGWGWGGRNHIFFKNWQIPLMVWVFLGLFWSGFRHLGLHTYPHCRVHFFWGGYPPYFWGGKFKKLCFGECWDSG